MSTYTYKKFEDGDPDTLPDKTTIYQECLQAFNASPVQAKKCRSLLAKLLRLLYSGETFPRTEATNLFFSISKLFHHNDPSLRQLVFLAIKELSSISNDILMATASIMKDIQSGDSVTKPNAVRALARVIDGSTIQAAERAIKNSVVDKNQSISSAALVSSYHLLPVAKEVVKHWTNETQESISSNKGFPPSQYATHEYYGNHSLPNSTYTYQYHALGLLYHLRNHDKMALMKMIQTFSDNSPLKSSLAIAQLIRYIGRIIEEDSNLTQPLFPYLANWLKHKSDMVELEAAKTILSLPKISGEQQMLAISTLQNLLSVPRTVTRFSAVRILNKIAMKSPEKIMICNNDLEGLINDPNRSISTYAITTLLKTGNSDNVDRLIKRISGFMDDISDEFKTIVIDAIKTLSLKFPEKHKSMLKFLNEILRDEGGFSFKNSIIEAIFDIIKFIPESKAVALEMLCDFIEDCEYTELVVRVLHLLGDEGPKTSNPSLYIRHIYNRVVLENSIVRSSAVIALSKFALIGNESITKSIKILLTRCLNDVDDEVRDRAALSLKLLSVKDVNEAKSFITPTFKYSLPILEKQLTLYVSGDKDVFSTPFDIKSIPTMTEEEVKAAEFKEKLEDTIQEDGRPSKGAAKEEETVTESVKQSLRLQQFSQEFASIEEFADYGELLHASNEAELTEKEIEFVVTAVKHVFKEYIVVQYNIKNTLKNVQLENVQVLSQPESEDYVEEFIMPIEILKADSEGSVYVSFKREDVSSFASCSFINTLSYISKDIDPSSNEVDPTDEGYPDEYQIEDLLLAPTDFIIPSFVGNFTHVWDELDNEESAVFNLQESSNDLQEIISKTIKSSSMMAMDSSDIVTSNSSHTLKLFGKSVNGDKIASIVRFAVSQKGVMMKNQVRSTNAELSELVANFIE